MLQFKRKHIIRSLEKGPKTLLIKRAIRYILPVLFFMLTISLLSYKHEEGIAGDTNSYLLVLIAASVLLNFVLLFLLSKAKSQKQAAVAEADESKKALDKVYNSGIIGLWYARFDGTIIEANDVFLNMIGYTRLDLENGVINWKVMTPPEHWETTQLAVGQLQTAGFSKAFEKEYIRKDGKRVSVLLASSVHGLDSKADIISFAIDTTEIKSARKREEELSERITNQQQEILRIFKNAPAAIIIRRGPDLRIDFANRAAQEIFSHRNFYGLTPEDYIKAAKSTLDTKLFRQVYETGKPYTAKSYHVKYDRYGTGKPVDTWFDFVLEPVYNAEGKVDGVATFCFEVTEIAKANLALKASEKQFRFIADALPNKLWTSDPSGQATYYNQGWYDYTGTKTFEELKEKVWSIIHPDDLERTREVWTTATVRGEDFQIEQRLQRHDGVYLWHLSRLQVQRDETGEINMWVGTSTDINDQKLTEEALSESEAHFKALANTNSLLIWQTNPDGITSYVNDTWRNYTGITAPVITEQHWLNAIHPEERVEISTLFNEAFSKREPVSLKYRFLNAQSGKYRWMLDTAHPVFNPDFNGYIGSMTDIHEQVMAQIATNMLMEKKDEFFGIASHELKTPITSMKASLQMLQRLSASGADIQKTSSLISMANKQVEKLTGIINDLLDVTRIQSGRMQLNKSSYMLRDSVMECIMEIRQNEPEHRIEIRKTSDISITADKLRMEQVIINFLSNAVKYSPGSPDIFVDIEEEPGFVRCSITDSGIGIPADKQSFIFDRFFRVHNSSQQFSGLGLGLFISSEIVKQHNGDVGMMSQEGKGSTFWFTLPV